MPIEQPLDLGGVEAGGRLVHHQQARRGRERARNLQHALLPVGERAGQHGGAIEQPDEAEERVGFVAAAHMIAPERAAMHDVLPRRDRMMDMESSHHVVEHGQLPEQPDLLERAREPESHAAVRRQADQVGAVEASSSRRRAGRAR